MCSSRPTAICAGVRSCSRGSARSAQTRLSAQRSRHSATVSPSTRSGSDGAACSGAFVAGAAARVVLLLQGTGAEGLVLLLQGTGAEGFVLLLQSTGAAALDVPCS